MEWLVPILFVLASLAQWWMQRNRQGQEEAHPEAPPQEKARSTTGRREPPPQEEFGDLGDLLEALGRRRHESPPPIENTEPPVLPSPPASRVSPPKREPTPVPIPEPVIILETPKPAPVPVFTAFPEARVVPTSEPSFVPPSEETPRTTFHPFPTAKQADTTFPHRWAEKLHSPDSVRDAIVLSEILAPPVSLR